MRPKTERGYRRAVLIGILLIVPVYLAAQDNTGIESHTDSGTDILTESLELDIATADREELAAWCLVLGLNTDGTENELRQRLRTYYGLTGAPRVRTGGPEGTTVLIESAQRSEYFIVRQDDVESETVVRLSGEVVIRVDERDRDRTHRVQADSIVFNQSNNTISAIGNISYTVNTGGREEFFSGDSLIFEVSGWTGVIFRGSSRRQQDVDGQTVDFLFRGESIERAGSDVLVLNRGVITSDDAVNPDYALKARKIWITGPGEWGLLSATLYVGHVPVFYLPFFWKAGDDLLFNPVIGFRTRVGYYLQTSTYLLGRKDEDQGFSIMGFGDSAGGDYELTRDGLFLVKRPTDSRPADQGGNTLKYMLDVYTALGAMTGFAGTFPKLGDTGALEFYSTIGVSRSIDSSGSVYFDDGGTSRTFWNSSYLGSYVVPFRWGTRFDLKLDRWRLYLDWYSDPYYLRDFGNRKENFDWLTFLLGQEGTETDDPDLVTDMRWEISGSHSVSTPDAAPWLQSVSLDNFRTSLTWRNKPNTDLSGNPDAEYDPARDFFYPDRLILPDIKLSLRGGSPQWSIDRIDAGVTSLSGPPFPGKPEDAENGIEDVPYRPSVDAVYSIGLLDASLKYGVQSQLYIDDQADSTAWMAPSDIDFGFEAARINTTQRADLSYAVDLWDGLTGISGSTNLSGYYQTHEDLFGDDAPVSETTVLEDYKYSKLLWDNRLNLYIKPFQGVPSLAESAFNYRIDTNLFSRQFADAATAADPDYDNSWISGASDFRQNEVSVLASWKPGVFRTSFTAVADLPPLSPKYTLSTGAGLDWSGLKLNLSQQTSYTDSDWNLQPLVGLISWTGWKDEVTVSQSARFDTENLRFSNAESVFRFWGFETRFNAGYGETYEWNGTEWDEAGEEFAAESLDFSYKREFQPLPLWKGRIRTRTVLDTAWNINLLQPSDNVLGFKWTQEFKVYKFLDLKLSFSSTNRSMYLYFPSWRDTLEVPNEYNFFTDLLKSFNFFNIQDRLDSHFNMDRLDLTLVHHLRNWDLTVEYSGWPALVVPESGPSFYRWKSEFSLNVIWNPIPIFNQRTSLENDKWTVDSFK